MATYAIGDVQGCSDALNRLLDKLAPGPDDRIWFAGDLVNRGPQSIEVLRTVRALGDRAIVVLGNHDLHLLALALAPAAVPRRREALEAVLEHPDASGLVEWLRHRPIAHHDPQLGCLLVHAGVPVQWDLRATLAAAGEVEATLRGSGCEAYFAAIYGNQPDLWDPALEGQHRLRFITNALTRMRYCTKNGRLDFDHNGPPGTQPANLLPWFDVPRRAIGDVRVVFGHWSSLGLLDRPDVLALDTGCVWGRQLTAARLDGSGGFISVDCDEIRTGAASESPAGG